MLTGGSPARGLTRGVVGWRNGRTRARVTCYLLPPMGLIADPLGARLAALIAESEESDRRLAELVADTRRLIDATDAMLAEERPE